MTYDDNDNFIKEIPSKEVRVEERRIDGRQVVRKIVGNDKLLNPQGAIASGSITQTMMANASIGQAQLKTETATLVFGAADTSKTATVTSGNIVIGYYASAMTTPAASWLTLSISGTTLTGTLSVAPGAGNSLTIVVVMLKT